MDLWVQLYKHCKFIVLLKNVYIYEAFRDDVFKKTQNGFQYLRLSTSPVLDT